MYHDVFSAWECELMRGIVILRRVATMTAYDSIERGAADEDERRRPRTFTLTHLLVACGAVCVCAIAATTVVNTRLETTPSLGWSKNGIWKWSPACKTKEKALKKDLMSCNADLKSKIDARSAELGDPVRNGRALLGSKNTCASAMKEEQDLLAECKAELAVHDENTKLKAQNENCKAQNENLKGDYEKLKGDYEKLEKELHEKLKSENEKPKTEDEKKLETKLIEAEFETRKCLDETFKRWKCVSAFENYILYQNTVKNMACAQGHTLKRGHEVIR